MLWPLLSHFDIHYFIWHHKDQPILILIMSIKINHNMIFKDRARNCKYAKNIIYFNDVMIKFSYTVTNFIKSLHTICKSDKIRSIAQTMFYFYQRNIIIYMQEVIMTDVHFHEKLKFEKPIMIFIETFGQCQMQKE